jgi:hypothetical protein
VRVAVAILQEVADQASDDTLRARDSSQHAGNFSCYQNIDVVWHSRVDGSVFTTPRITDLHGFVTSSPHPHCESESDIEFNEIVRGEK